MSDYISEGRKDFFDIFKNKKETVIYKGCYNEICCCNGDCKKVIGHTNADGTKVYYEQPNEFGLDEISN